MTVRNARRALGSLLAIGALAFAASAYASGSDAGVGRHGHDRTIKLVEASAVAKPAFVDLGAPGPSPGDLVVVKDGVTRPDGGAAGDLRQVCTLVEVGTNPLTSSYECSGSIVLPEGTIIIQGPFVPAAPEQLQAVTGGTGEFRIAQGDAVVRAEDDEITVRLAR
jgi:hypothetical protein